MMEGRNSQGQLTSPKENIRQYAPPAASSHSLRSFFTKKQNLTLISLVNTITDV